MTASSITQPPVVAKRAVRRLQAAFRHVSGADAVDYIGLLLREGHSRPTPRRWMRAARFGPGTRFVYSHREPDVCLVVRRRAVTAVIVRGDALDGPPSRRGRPRTPIERFDWRRLDPEELAA